jgi:hypothetical protein
VRRGRSRYRWEVYRILTIGQLELEAAFLALAATHVELHAHCTLPPSSCQPAARFEPRARDVSGM